MRHVRIAVLHLEQYRNYRALTQQFSHDSRQFLVGYNGSGKTNILESIALLSLTQSFLGIDDDDLVRWGDDFYRVRAELVTDRGEPLELEVCSVLRPRREKACFRSRVRTAARDMIGLLPVVAFLPQDLALFTGPPQERRRLLDQLLSQVSPEYVHHLHAYQKALKQRATLLRRIAEHAAGPADLDPWDALLIMHGEPIVRARREFLATCNCSLTRDVQDLGESWKEVTLSYDAGTLINAGRTFPEALMERRERDMLLLTTTVGPHRDDWAVTVDGRDLTTFASRGQQRVTALALLLLQAAFLEVRRGERPIVLLDDIFSELDALHRERVLASLHDHQVFLTTTEEPSVQVGAVWRVGEGALHQAAAQ
jgi:DNA replication and repair protein RecF